VKIAFKFFSDPQLAQEALAALQSSGYPSKSIGVLVRGNGSAADVAAGLEAPLVEAGTMPDVGPVAAAGADVFGLPSGQSDADASVAVAAALGLPVEALGTFAIGLLRGGVLVAVRTEDEGLAEVQRVLRRAEPANVRIPKQHNEGFELAERNTATKDNDNQFSGDFRKY
jgi:hypothetical protein